MPVLPQVLREAAHLNATEVVLEVGREPLARTGSGLVEVGAPLTERALFDALEAVLVPEQLAELAVGHVVEFEVSESSSQWRLLAEPNAEGVVVRGRLEGAGREDDLDIGDPMHLPPLEPFVPDRHGTASGNPGGEMRRPVIEQEEDDPDPAAWLVRNDESREAATPGPGALDFDDTASVADRFSEDTDDLLEGDEDLLGPDRRDWDDDDPDELSLPDLIDPDLGDERRPTMRRSLMEEGDLRSRQTAEALDPSDPFAGIAASIDPGSLCVIRGRGVAESLARQLDAGAYTVIDDNDPMGTMRRAAKNAPGGTYVVRLEDPSPCLGWMLRRIEEGGRVVLETRARTVEGARRILLGTSHGPHADAWLDAHPIVWVSQHDGAWTIRS